MGGGSEGAEEEGGVTVCGQALAADVADDQPGTGEGACRGEEVAAHFRLLLGRQVQRGDLQWAAASGQRTQQDLLGHRGDRAALDQAALIAVPDGGEEDDQCGDHHQRGDLRLKVLREEDLARHADEHLGGDRERPDRGRQAGAGESCGDCGGRDQEGPEVDTGRREEVDRADGRDEADREQHQQMTQFPSFP
ncbi:hypothetical protein [Streptomyces endophytica]|uniref:hypothetical protein n=1 Tax=Streptomyces endophytica TaxID=2991496 RepID=UPI003C6F1CFC